MADEKMQVEITEPELKDTDEGTGVFHHLHEGDRITVSKACGTRWVTKHGWAKDVGGKLEQAKRKPGAQRFDVNDLKQKVKKT